MHIQKCGGTSFRKALEAYYPQQLCWHLNVKQLAIKNDMGEIDQKATYQLRHKNVLKAFKANYHLISGHYQYHPENFRSFHDTYTFITVIREPTSRVISFYYYLKSKSDASSKLYLKDLSLEEFINNVDYNEINYMTRFFSGFDLNDSAGNIDKALDEAKQNLLKFNHIGFLDDLNSFYKAIFNSTGLKLKIKHHKQGKYNNNTEKQTIKTCLPKLHELCSPDIELFEFAKTHIKHS